MGTNFYQVASEDEKCTYENHIGKRSAAGHYCWDCRQTLCADGESRVHHANTPDSDYDVSMRKTKWFDCCPSCGEKKQEGSQIPNAAMLELGFREQKLSGESKGVRTVCSFLWACHLYEIDETKLVKNEYGDVISFEDFRKMLEVECPIRDYSAIGREFS